MKKKTIARDISWLSFNARVLQEAADPAVPLKERVKFLGIFSNNTDEFFRVRVATLKRMIELESKTFRGKANMHIEESPEKILQEIQLIVLRQQNEFNRVWEDIIGALRREKIFLVNEKQLTREQKVFVLRHFEEEVRSNIIPLMIENIPLLPYLRDKSIYLGVVMSSATQAPSRQYALIEIPSRALGRFVLLPSAPGEQHIMLLEDVVRFNLPSIFSYFGYDNYDSWIFKVTRDAEIDIDNDISTTLIQKIEKGIRNRRRGKPVRFVYDKEMDAGLLEYLMRKMNMSRKDNLIPGGRIHNFRHFMDFPDVITKKSQRKKPFTHPLLTGTKRVTDVVLEKDILLNFPYHSFNGVLDMLREAAMDPYVTSIKVTAYRLAPHSKLINALINAVRNGKQVTVMMELRARFDEEANLEWKERLEEEGVKVLIGIPNMKVHAKLCLIKKRVNNKTTHYGFVSTGNLNEKTAAVYGDQCLLTSNRNIMADVNRVFQYLEKPKEGEKFIRACRTLILCPFTLREQLLRLIQKEIKMAEKGKPAAITIKMNSLSDEQLIYKLYDAARAGVSLNLVIRGICCMLTENKHFSIPVKAISIVDEYLEHSRILIFHNGGKEKVFISSADWMVRNLDHRVEVTCPILNPGIKKVLQTIIDIQLRANVKARLLNNGLTNEYVQTSGPRVRAQVEIYNYLHGAVKKLQEAGDSKLRVAVIEPAEGKSDI